MSTKQSAGNSAIDTLKWVIVAAVLISALVANAWFTEVDTSLRAAVGVIVVGVSALLAWQTQHGKTFVRFVKDARMEMRKVVWPTRQEVSRNTILVVLIVMVMSGVLWGMDTMFAWLIAKFVG